VAKLERELLVDFEAEKGRVKSRLLQAEGDQWARLGALKNGPRSKPSARRSTSRPIEGRVRRKQAGQLKASESEQTKRPLAPRDSDHEREQRGGGSRLQIADINQMAPGDGLRFRNVCASGCHCSCSSAPNLNERPTSSAKVGCPWCECKKSHSIGGKSCVERCGTHCCTCCCGYTIPENGTFNLQDPG